MRLFVGIPLAATVTEQLSAIAARLRSRGDGLRWSAPESWHITLQFLGNTDQEHYACVVARLRELHAPPVPISLEGLGLFDRSGILFAGVRLTPELLSLQARITEATALCGFLPEARPYQPHITLARGKRERQPQSLQELKAKLNHHPNFTRFVCQQFLLYESFLDSAGSRYQIRERFDLDRR
jgi:2'-5' RNA ligase